MHQQAAGFDALAGVHQQGGHHAVDRRHDPGFQAAFGGRQVLCGAGLLALQLRQLVGVAQLQRGEVGFACFQIAPNREPAPLQLGQAAGLVEPFGDFLVVLVARDQVLCGHAGVARFGGGGQLQPACLQAHFLLQAQEPLLQAGDPPRHCAAFFLQQTLQLAFFVLEQLGAQAKLFADLCLQAACAVLPLARQGVEQVAGAHRLAFHHRAGRHDACLRRGDADQAGVWRQDALNGGAPCVGAQSENQNQPEAGQHGQGGIHLVGERLRQEDGAERMAVLGFNSLGSK